MKSMTCRQLGGACDKVFIANTFDEIAEMSKQHGIEMFRKNDAAHLEAMKAMQEIMSNKQEIQIWMESKRALFNASPAI